MATDQRVAPLVNEAILLIYNAKVLGEILEAWLRCDRSSVEASLEYRELGLPETPTDQPITLEHVQHLPLMCFNDV